MEEEPREQLIQGLLAILGKDGLEKLKTTVGIQDDMEAVAGLLDFYISESGCDSAEAFIRAAGVEEPPQ